MSLFIGNNKSRLNYSPSSYQQGISNYPFLVYQANIDASNPPSPWSEQWKQITESSLINKIRELNGLNETIETQLVDFTNGIYNHNSPANGTMSVRIDGNTVLDNVDAPTKMTSVGEEITLSNGEKCNKIEVLSTSKNIADPKYVTYKNNINLSQFQSAIDVDVEIISRFIPGKTYAISFDNNKITSSSLYINEHMFNEYGGVRLDTLGRKYVVVTCKNTFNSKSALFKIATEGVNNIDLSNLQITMGNILNQPYEPYVEDKTEILTRNGGLRKVDTAIDKRYSDGKVWRETGEYILNNTSNLIPSTIKPNLVTFLATDIKNISLSDATKVCVLTDNSTLKAVKQGQGGFDSDIEGICSLNWKSAIVGQILKSKLATPDINGFKTWLQNNPIKIQYPLLNPNYEHILSFVKCLPNGVSDEIRIGDGIWEVSTGVKSIKGEIYLKENVYKCVLNGAESWVVNNNNPTGYLTWHLVNGAKNPIRKDSDYINIITDNMKNKLWGETIAEELILCAKNSICLRLSTTKNVPHTSDGVKNWLSQNPQPYMYELATPTYRVLTAEEKAEYNAKKQYLDKMLVLNSFKGGNLVINSGEVSPSGKLMYTTDVKDENILVMSCGEVGKSKAIVCRVSLKELMNSLYGGSFTALKTAIQRLAGVSYSDKSKLYYWNGTQYVLLGENTNTSIKEIKATFDKSVLTDENIALMLVSSTPATSTVPSILSLDHIKLECDITRTPETIDLGNDSVVTLPSTWSILCKGISFDTVTNGNIIQIGSHIVNIPIVDIPTDRFKATNILIQQQNGVLTTCILKQPNDNISINQEDKTILGANRISLMNGDFFEDSIHYFPNKVWNLNEVKILLTGKIPTGFENNSEMIALKNSAKNPNLLPQSVFNNASIRRLDGETVINGNADIIALESNKNKSYDIVILPNNVYELSVQSLQYPLVIDEYCGNYLIKSEICKVDNTKKVGLFKTNSNTNMIRLRFNSADFNPPAK